MKKRSIAIFYENVLRERDAHRFGLNIISKYFDVYLIDFSLVEADKFSEFNLSKKKNTFSKYNVISIEGYKHLYSFLNNNALNYYIDVMGNSFLSFRIRMLLKKRNTLRIKIYLGLIPWVPYKLNLVTKISNLIKTRAFLSKILKVIFSKIFLKLEPPIDVLLYSGSKSKIAQNHKSLEIWTHSFDYQTYLEIEKNTEFDNLGRFALFIDQYAPSHPDYKFHNNEPPVSEKNYYKTINSFFDFFEKRTGLKVIIAGHPKRDIDTSKIWNGRTQIVGKTPELIRQSNIVISHYSTALSFAVIYRKPILLITTDEYYNSYRKHQFLAFSEALNIGIVNTDNFNEHEITDNIFNINEASMQDYQEKYIRSKNSSSNDIWKHFSEKLLEIRLQK
ncbi:hypothetical protein N8202_05990 [Gammaproteobacteria bacterium]|jgi:hypothetical protein|nr:hypothetical protein [Gammaproteobacteria bacterium]